jgi:hypothetical protein
MLQAPYMHDSKMYRAQLDHSCMFTLFLELHSVVAPADCLPSTPPKMLENSTSLQDGLYSLGPKNIGLSGSGILVIIPNMTFDCYGSVSGWTGIVSFDVDTLFVQEELAVHFQVWRPFGNGTYSLVGSEPVVFNYTTISETLLTPTGEANGSGDTYYHSFLGSDTSWSASGGIAFQPGDVVGCLIPAPSVGEGSSSALGLAYRRSGQDEGSGGEVDLLVYPVEGDICEAATVCEGSKIISSVQLQLFPHQECEYIIIENEIRISGQIGCIFIM